MDRVNDIEKLEWRSGRPEGFTSFFKVTEEKEQWLVEFVGRDAAGNYVLYSSQDYVVGASTATTESHAVLSREEYLAQLDKACGSGKVSTVDYARFKEL